MLRTLALILVLSIPAAAQFMGGKDPRWQTVGAGALAARPATCVANKHVYVCNGAGCGVNGEYHYCTALNTWTVPTSPILRTATIATLPAGVSDATIWYLTDSNYRVWDIAGARRWLFNDWTVTRAPTAGWSGWDQQGTCTLDTSGGVLRIVNTNGAAAGTVRTYYRPAPAANFELTVLLQLEAGISGAYHGGLVLRSSTGQLISYNLGFFSPIFRADLSYWTNATTFSSTPWTSTPVQQESYAWVRFRVTAANIEAWHSYDGVYWYQHGATLARGAFLADVTSIGVAVYNNHANAVTGLSILSWVEAAL